MGKKWRSKRPKLIPNIKRARVPKVTNEPTRTIEESWWRCVRMRLERRCKDRQKVQAIFAKHYQNARKIQDHVARHFGRISVLKHWIEWESPNKRAVLSTVYRAGPEAMDIETQEAERMLGKIVIVPSLTVWAAKMIITSRKDWSPHFCIDYRKLITVTVKITRIRCHVWAIISTF